MIYDDFFLINIFLNFISILFLFFFQFYFYLNIYLIFILFKPIINSLEWRKKLKETVEGHNCSSLNRLSGIFISNLKWMVKM